MNYKQILPTYRRRLRFVGEELDRFYARRGKVRSTLHLGCGEAEFDYLLSQYTETMTSVDINPGDIGFAKKLNSDLENVEYRIGDACALDFEDATFDRIISLETIEHVPNYERFIQECARVLEPGGHFVLSFPSIDYPLTYDPINKLLGGGRKLISAGAYGFGHDWLPEKRDIREKVESVGLRCVREEMLSGPLVGLLECYLPGMLQSLLKSNSANIDEDRFGEVQANVHSKAGAMQSEDDVKGIRPNRGVPKLVWMVDLLNAIDQRVSLGSSVGVGQVYRKEE